MMKLLDKEFFRIYDRIYPYLKNFRGATRLHQDLMKYWLSNKIEQYGDYFVSEYSGVKLKSKRFSDQQDIFVEKLIDSYLFNYELERGDTVIMAGAYPGMFVSYVGKKIGQEGKVIAIEPDPDNREILEENVRLNDLQNVEIVQKAVFQKETTIDFEAGEGHGSRIKEHGGYTVQTTVLDNFQEVKPDLICMDIEGAEIEAVKGAKQLISNSDTRFAVRSYHTREGKPTSIEIEDIVRELGREPMTKSEYPIETTTYF